MERRFHDHVGGIRGLLDELKAHGEAITHDLIRYGWLRTDVGRRMGWREFWHWLRWLPPTGECAYWRSKKPRSWWVTPDLQLLAGVLYAVEGANWQRGGGKGSPPKPVKFPEDREVPIKDLDELNARKDEIKRRRRG